MKKFYQKTTCYLAVLVTLLLVTVCMNRTFAQVTISTESGTSFDGLNGVAGNGAVTFVVENTNATAVTLTQVDAFWTTDNSGAIPSLWYTTSALSGAPTIGSPGWILAGVGSAITVAADGYLPTLTGLGISIPAGAQYRFALESSAGINYSGSGAVTPTPNTFSSNGVNLKVGNALIGGSNIGYGGGFPSPTFNPRFFTGRVIINTTPPSAVPPCASNFSPADGATNVVANAVLNWTGTSEATSYDVYFGTTATPPLVANSIANTYVIPSLLNFNTTYYYRVVPKNSVGDATGCPVYSFTTGTSFNYCVPGASDCTLADEILNVTFNGINNSSSGCSGSGYTDYTSLAPANLFPAQNAAISVSIGAGGNDNVGVWIDFNQNGVFDGSEYTYLGNLETAGTINGSIAVPANALSGNTRMRVRVVYSDLFLDTDACFAVDYGETEDYTVNIGNPPSTNGAIVDIIPPNGCSGSNIVSVKLRNSGSQDIPAGAATVALYITDANPQGPLTLSNSSIIVPGDTATLDFTCSFATPGFNVDSAFILSLAGDNLAGDDSLVTAHITLPPPAVAPYAEDFEGTVPGWTVQQIAGSGVWGLAPTVDYPDYTPPFSLSPKSGAQLALFDSYNFNAGTLSRLSSNCITLPADANSNCGYVAGFYFTQDAQYLTLRDSVVVSITTDGGNSYTRLGVVKRIDSTLSPTTAQAPASTPVWKLYTFDISSYAGQTVQIAFEGYGNFGNAMGIDSFFVNAKTVASNIALAGGQENGATLTPALFACTDADNWTYYSDSNSSRYLFGIQWDIPGAGNNSVAKAQATARLNIDRKWYAAEDAASQKATYTMQRYWDVNLNGATLASPVNVRFFFNQSELDSIITAKNNFLAANPGSRDEGFVWFKTNSGPFVPGPGTVTPDGVVDAIPLANTNTSDAKINGILYAQFNGITSFSGGTAASGVGPLTPVPVSLLSFEAIRTGRINTINWTTSQELNTRTFVVEHSTDGRNYLPIGSLAAGGNTSNTRNYSFQHSTPARGINYYRLKIIDTDNRQKFSVVRNVRNEGTADVAIYPNPVKDVLRLNINSDLTDRAAISVTDMSGKLVFVKTLSVVEGANYININTANISNGTYVIKIQLNNDLLVRKFNKF